MAQLTQVQFVSDSEWYVVDIDTADEMLEDETIITQDATEGVVTLQDVYGDDYDGSGTFSGT